MKNNLHLRDGRFTKQVGGDSMYKILIAEDDKALCNNIKESISKWNFKALLSKILKIY